MTIAGTGLLHRTESADIGVSRRSSGVPVW